MSSSNVRLVVPDVSSGNRYKLDNKMFDRLAVHIERLTGIKLPFNPKNEALISGRLTRLKKMLSLSQDSDVQILAMLDARDPTVSEAFISMVTTHTTSFFREATHFDLLTKVLPRLMAENRKNGKYELRIWCAATSTGEEVYSILMTIWDQVVSNGFEVKMLASDIDMHSLQRAREAVYDEKDFTRLLPDARQKFLVKLRDRPGKVQIAQELRDKVHFGVLNLTDQPFPFMHQFDVIFCRNVFIYFDPKMVVSVLASMAKHIRTGGHLFLGHAESLAQGVTGFDRVGPAVYMRSNEKVRLNK